MIEIFDFNPIPKAIAIIPVFKIDIDMSQYSVVRDNKALRKQKKKPKRLLKPIKKGEKRTTSN